MNLFDFELRDFSKSAGAIVLSSYFNGFLIFLTQFILAKYLSTNEFGFLYSALLVVSFFSYISGFRLDSFILKEYGNTKKIHKIIKIEQLFFISICIQEPFIKITSFTIDFCQITKLIQYFSSWKVLKLPSRRRRILTSL